MAATLAVLLAFVGPWRSTITDRITDGFQSVRSMLFPRFQPVNPTGVSGSSASRAHPAGLAIDGDPDTYWAEGAKGNGERQFLLVRFQVPTRIAKMIITSGARPDQFLRQPRPHKIRLIFSDNTTKDAELDDSEKPQTLDVEGERITQVEIRILSVYLPLDGTGSDCAIAEVEFRTQT